MVLRPGLCALAQTGELTTLVHAPFASPQVRVYNLAKQALARKLVAGSGVITSMALHTSGDHLIVGSEDKRLW